MTRSLPPLARAALLAVTVLAALAPTFASAQSAPQSREREMLRRVQTALRDVTAERDAARAAEAALKARVAELQAERDRARAEAGALRGPLQQADAERVRLQAAVQEERDKAERDRVDQAAQVAAANQRESDLRGELAAMRRSLDERTQANASLSALLERSTAALKDAERRNAELHTLGLAVIERWRHKTPAEALLHGERLIGWAGVKAEDQAEQWRQQADALSRPPAAR